MATYWENSCSFGLRYVSWYKCLIVSLVFSHLGFRSGNLFRIAPFPDLCLLVPFYHVYKKLEPNYEPSKINISFQASDMSIFEIDRPKGTFPCEKTLVMNLIAKLMLTMSSISFITCISSPPWIVSSTAFLDNSS